MRNLCDVLKVVCSWVRNDIKMQPAGDFGKFKPHQAWVQNFTPSAELHSVQTANKIVKGRRSLLLKETERRNSHWGNKKLKANQWNLFCHQTFPFVPQGNQNYEKFYISQRQLHPTDRNTNVKIFLLPNLSYPNLIEPPQREIDKKNWRNLRESNLISPSYSITSASFLLLSTRFIFSLHWHLLS